MPWMLLRVNRRATGRRDR